MEANELSCKDLMIGDWVFYSKKAFPYQIKLIGENLCKLDGIDNSVKIDEIYPVLLTEVVLKKNGFKLHNKRVGIFKDNYCQIKVHIAPKLEIDGMILDEPPIDLQIDGATFSINMIIEYVHELQHALRLCGIEKTIEL